MSELEIAAEDFEEKVLKSNQPVVVDFFATWCGPCKMLAPTIEKLSANYSGKAGVFKIDTDKGQKLATQFGIRGVPTLIFFKNGKEATRIVGFVPYEKLASTLDELL